MKIELWPIDSVKPYPNNPRINDPAVAGVVESLKQFGFRQPIVVDVDGVIVAGHTRWKAAQALELKRVPVHVARDLTPEQIRAYRLADNKTAEASDWDMGLLKIELSELRDADVDLNSLGFSAEDLATVFAVDAAEAQTDPDFIPPKPPKATTKPGQLWILGNHRLLCGDSSKPEVLDRLLGGAEIHLVNTDPPYNVKVEPRSNNAIAAGLSSFATTSNQSGDLARDPSKAKKTDETLRAKDRPLANDFVSEAEFDRLLKAWFENLARVLQPGRAFYIWGGFANVGNYPAPLRAAGLYFAQAIIWAKNQPVLTRKDFMTSHEWCFYGWREGAAHQFFGAANIADVWEIKRIESADVALGRGLQLEAHDGSRLEVLPPTHDKLPTVMVQPEGMRIMGSAAPTDLWHVRKVPGQKMVHLTEKPVELAVRAMQYSSRPGEHVLDLFGGSGSTLIAAEMTGRKAFLTELDPCYCDVIVKRWEAFTGRKAQLVTVGKETVTIQAKFLPPKGKKPKGKKVA
jgi:DNA modification methylase